MATVLNAFTATADTANGTSYATGSFTPVADDLLVVYVAASDTVAAAPTLTASANSMTFTRLTSPAAPVKDVSRDTLYTFVADQLVPASPVAMTLTFDCTGDAATGCIISGAAVTGMSKTGTTAILQAAASADNVPGGTAPETTFAAACQTSNPTLFAPYANVSTGTVEPTGWTERADVNHGSPASSGGFASRDSGFTGTVITLGSTSNGSCCAIAHELDASASGLSAPANPALETDAAQPVGKAASRTASPALETDAAQLLGRTKTKALLPPAAATSIPETIPFTPGSGNADTAQTLGRVKTKALGTATETDTAQPITVPPALGLALESDAAQPLGRVKSLALGLALEAGTALGLGRSKVKALGPATETDAAQLFGRSKVRLLGISTETGAAQPVGRVKARALGAAAETDAAQPIAVATGDLGIALETDAALSVARSKVKAVSAATETDAAQAVTRSRGWGLGIAAETDTASPLSPGKARPLDIALGLDAAQPVARVKARSIAAAAETDAAQPLGPVKARTVGLVTETDAAQPLARVKGYLLGAAVEAALALLLGRSKVMSLGAAEETDLARPITEKPDLGPCRVYRGRLTALAAAGDLVDVAAGHLIAEQTGGATP